MILNILQLVYKLQNSIEIQNVPAHCRKCPFIQSLDYNILCGCMPLGLQRFVTPKPPFICISFLQACDYETMLSQIVVYRSKGGVKAAHRGVQVKGGPKLKGTQIKNYSEIYVDIIVNQTSRMQDLAISGTSDFKIFPGRIPPRNLLIIVLQDVITRGPKSNFTPIFPSVLCSVCWFWRISIVACFVVTHYYKGVFRNFQGGHLLSSAQPNFTQKCAVIKNS